MGLSQSHHRRPHRYVSHLLSGLLIAGVSLACAPMAKVPGGSSSVAATPPQQAEPPPRLSLPALFTQQTAAIEAISQRQGRQVTITGAIQRQVPLVAHQLYQVQDDTGSVWVVTHDTAATVGDRVTVKGTVLYREILIGGSNLSEFYLQAEQIQIEPSSIN